MSVSLESDQLHLLKRLRLEGWVMADSEDCGRSLEVLLETGLVRTVSRSGPAVVVLSGPGVRAAESPYWS